MKGAGKPAIAGFRFIAKPEFPGELQMKNQSMLFLVFAAVALANLAIASAGEESTTHQHKTVIALQTDDFEIAETDISDLQVGESETIVTDSGKVIDLLRTEDGVEIYVDGELLEMTFGDEAGIHGDHGTLHKRVQIICESEDDCEESVWVSEMNDLESLSGADGEHQVIRKTIKVECEGEDDCSKHNIWIGSGDDIDIEALHEHGAAQGIVMIKRGEGEHDVEIITDENAELHGEKHGKKIMIIKQKSRED
jgi:hypothetical protein